MLVLVRHGEATGNAAGVLLGRTDAPLTDRGVAQAVALAPRMGVAERCLSSPLRRAVGTAELLGLGVPVQLDERWIERDYGEEEGTPYRELGSPGWGVNSKWSDVGYRPAGGESLADIAARVADACSELFAEGGKGARVKDADVIVVSHVSPIKAAVAWALGVGDEMVWRMHLSTASVTKIGWSAGAPQLVTYNWTP